MNNGNTEQTQEHLQGVIATTELSLAMLEFMYYYLVHWPEQKRALTIKKGP
jgi:hypothetical protein